MRMNYDIENTECLWGRYNNAPDPSIKNSCRDFAVVTQLTLLAGEVCISVCMYVWIKNMDEYITSELYIHSYIHACYQSWLTTIALDLVYSLTNPFISYKTNLRRYQIMVRTLTQLHVCMHAYIHTYIHAFIHTYIHAYIIGLDFFVVCVVRFLLRHRMPRPVPGYPPYIHTYEMSYAYIHAFTTPIAGHLLGEHQLLPCALSVGILSVLDSMYVCVPDLGFHIRLLATSKRCYCTEYFAHTYIQTMEL
jgi:hypothetical protein